jgi:hypothetical protein
MRQLTATLALALSLIGCGSARPDVQFRQDLIDNKHCSPERYVVGQLVASPDLAILDHQGVLTPLTWPSSYSLRWSPGLLTGQIDVLDDTGTVVATVGHRYKIGGMDFIGNGTFWACAGVIPQ